jgi:hypothetical protein
MRSVTRLGCVAQLRVKWSSICRQRRDPRPRGAAGCCRGCCRANDTSAVRSEGDLWNKGPISVDLNRHLGIGHADGPDRLNDGGQRAGGRAAQGSVAEGADCWLNSRGFGCWVAAALCVLSFAVIDDTGDGRDLTKVVGGKGWYGRSTGDPWASVPTRGTLADVRRLPRAKLQSRPLRLPPRRPERRARLWA